MTELGEENRMLDQLKLLNKRPRGWLRLGIKTIDTLITFFA